MKQIVILTAVLPAICWAASLTAAPVEIDNETFLVRYDNESNAFTVEDRATGKVFVTEGRLDGAAGAAVESAVTDPTFGQGRSLHVPRGQSGGFTSVEVYPSLPFVLVRETIANPGADVSEISKAVPADFAINLGKPVSELKTMGTAGLLPPGKNPGSFLFLTCADPATRNGVVAGWITEDRGSGALFSSLEGGQVNFRAQIDYGHLRIPGGGSAKLETLAIGYFDDARLGEEAYAEAVKKQYNIKLRTPEGTYCSWYSEQHGYAGDEKSTVELAKFAKGLKPFGLGVLQIDDQWQDGGIFNGPRRGFDRVRPDGPYAHGLAPVAAAVEREGLAFGIWWLPFGRNFQDPEYKNRQDWFVKRQNGKPYDVTWGGTCLDLTNPEVRNQLASIAASYRSWGIKYFKMDGLWTGAACELTYGDGKTDDDGYKDDHFGNNQTFHDPNVTNIEAYRSGLALIRKNSGDDVFFSGCAIAQNRREMTAIGLVDSMRVAPDATNNIQAGPLRGSRLFFMNGRIWWNDPDVAVVRAKGSFMGVAPVTRDEARLTTTWVALTGQFYLLSDWLPALPAERLEIVKRTMSHHDAAAMPVDYFDRNMPYTWVTTDTRQSTRRDVIGIFNFDRRKIRVDYVCQRMGLDPAKTYHAFDFWDNTLLPDFKGEFKAEAAPRSCRAIAVRADEGHPLLLSTSRHVTQGIVDVTGETWNVNTLSAQSEVIANDPYELRIAGVAGGGKLWKAAGVEVSGDDKASGVTATLRRDGPNLVRVSLSSPVTRPVQWKVKFEPNASPAAPAGHGAELN